MGVRVKYGYRVWTPHPVIVTRRDNKDCIRVLLYSSSTTITGWGVLLTHTAKHQSLRMGRSFSSFFFGVSGARNFLCMTSEPQTLNAKPQAPKPESAAENPALSERVQPAHTNKPRIPRQYSPTPKPMSTAPLE